jgi:AmmeMemoRadiSam system protein A
MNDPVLGRSLVRIARSAIAVRLGVPAGEDADRAHPALTRPAATFVTLTQEKELRGCIGSLEPSRPLAVDVRENAVAAAFRDPRFAPLAVHEFVATSVEVSLLGPSQPIRFVDETHLLAQLAPGVDGLILEFGGRRATFLPQVWEKIPDKVEFLENLCYKMGSSPDTWRTKKLEVLVYQVEEFHE